MENNELYQKKIAKNQADDQVPDRLLSNVLTRLAQRQAYLDSNLPPQDVIAGLTHPAWEIRTAALQALDSSSTSVVLHFLLPALEDEHRLVRVAALRALSRLEKKAPAEYLLRALRDTEWEVREMAVLCLSELNIQETDLMGALLRVALHDPQITVRDAAQYALDTHENARANNYTPSQPAAIVQAKNNSVHVPGLQLAEQTIRNAIHYGIILKRQVALIQKSVWFGALCIVLLGSILTCMGMLHTPVDHSNLPRAISYLVLFMCISAAAGTAFLYGGENDHALELTLATPTSIRMIMLFRFALVLSYNVLLSLCASMVIALLHGGGLWEVIQLWLGPMVLIASLTFSISLLLGSWVSLVTSLITTAIHILSFNANLLSPSIDLLETGHWQVSPLTFCGALLLLIVAICYAPHQPHLEAI
jgi:hypothetical protein